MKCGIVGLPNVGKSTLFNCLSNAKALAANYPFATIEPNIGIIPVPDKRLDELVKMINPKNVQSAIVEIVDIAGLVKGASKGEGLGNKFLANIRETNAIIHVLRCFEDSNITHVDGVIDPVADKETVEFELQLKDIETLEKRQENLKRIANSGDKNALKELKLINQYHNYISSGNSARNLILDDNDCILKLNLLTNKPVLYVCNVDEKSINGNQYTASVKESLSKCDSKMLIISAAIEADINELDSTSDKYEFLESVGLEEPGVNKVIKSAYSLLGLHTFFTAGEKEVRAWTIKQGAKAPQAAGVIHTDFEKGFIRAEVITYKDRIQYKTEQACREAGKVSIEGKNYEVCDGDVVHFRFNV
ncbi:MAG: redox-regulated ATPase YchF [Flavobacteriales bacterium]|nr:redox-regulated ATPase YchF [Flavobacteriales bacterium]|tara:strand:+ start:8226 stop:9308 length:1083 start_codon:yes stop_codon:yes gene_type:complete